MERALAVALKSFVASATLADMIAARAELKLLALYHQLLWGVAYDELVAEIKGCYAGEVVSSRDLDVF